MKNSKYYLALANRAEDAAGKAKTEVARRTWKAMAQQYRALAAKLRADPTAALLHGRRDGNPAGVQVPPQGELTTGEITDMTYSHVTPCGLPGVGPVPVGLHSCHFYSDRQELVDALVPFTLAGLRAKERCLIIASPPLPAKDLVQELRQGGDGVEEALHSGALRVVDFDRWYLLARRV